MRIEVQSKEPRACGSCNLCCTVMGVKELGKEKDVRCNLLTKSGSCSVYGKHPPSCQEFKCLWLQGILPSNLFPGSVRAVGATTDEGNCLVWHVAKHESSDVYRKGKLRDFIDTMGAKGIPSIIAHGDKRLILHPPVNWDGDLVIQEANVDQDTETLITLERR